MGEGSLRTSDDLDSNADIGRRVGRPGKLTGSSDVRRRDGATGRRSAISDQLSGSGVRNRLSAATGLGIEDFL